MKRVCVYTTTYNRPTELLDLLRDVGREAARDPSSLDIHVRVYDDASSLPYTAARDLVSQRKWSYARAEINHGKRRYWEWMNFVYRDLRRQRAAYYIQLPDDVRLCHGFFSRIIDQWESIRDPKKAVLNPLHDTIRSTEPCWTGVRPTPGGSVDRVGWVDLCQLSTRDFFRTLGWQIHPIGAGRWQHSPTRSSGVGAQISNRLLQAGRTMYRSSRSLVVHRYLGSAMNPLVRQKQSIEVKDYVDGPQEASRLAAGDDVTASLAAIPSRVAALERVVSSLLPQVGRLCVYLNGYDSVPAFLAHPRVTVGRSQETGDNGDGGKFWWSGKLSGFCLTCDDDLVYPANYAAQLISALRAHRLSAVVGLHGVRIVEPVASYYKSRTVYPCLADVGSDVRVHVLGTGALAYHTSTIRVASNDFRAPNMADIWFAVLGQQQRVPFICLGHRADTLQHIRHKSTIYSASVGRDTQQTQVVQDRAPWWPAPLDATVQAATQVPAVGPPSRQTLARPARRR